MYGIIRMNKVERDRHFVLIMGTVDHEIIGQHKAQF